MSGFVELGRSGRRGPGPQVIPVAQPRPGIEEPERHGRDRVGEAAPADLEDVLPVVGQVGGDGDPRGQEIAEPPGPERLAPVVLAGLGLAAQPGHDREAAEGDLVPEIEPDPARRIDEAERPVLAEDGRGAVPAPPGVEIDLGPGVEAVAREEVLGRPAEARDERGREVVIFEPQGELVMPEPLAVDDFRQLDAGVQPLFVVLDVPVRVVDVLGQVLDVIHRRPEVAVRGMPVVLARSPGRARPRRRSSRSRMPL